MNNESQLQDWYNTQSPAAKIVNLHWQQQAHKDMQSCKEDPEINAPRHDPQDTNQNYDGETGERDVSETRKLFQYFQDWNGLLCWQNMLCILRAGVDIWMSCLIYLQDAKDGVDIHEARVYRMQPTISQYCKLKGHYINKVYNSPNWKLEWFGQTW